MRLRKLGPYLGGQAVVQMPWGRVEGRVVGYSRKHIWISLDGRCFKASKGRIVRIWKPRARRFGQVAMQAPSGRANGHHSIASPPAQPPSLKRFVQTLRELEPAEREAWERYLLDRWGSELVFKFQPKFLPALRVSSLRSLIRSLERKTGRRWAGAADR